MKANQGKCDNAGAQQAPVGGSLSAKALEYYRMYAASEELPRYFCGGDVAGVDTPTPTPTTSSVSTVRYFSTQPMPEIVVDECACASPTGSVLSKKQLEWDSGADIGYANIDQRAIQKSVSLPSLERRRGARAARRPPEPMDNLGSGDNTDDDVAKHKEFLSFLRHKVGMPDAESTPVAVDLKKSESDPAIYPESTPAPRPKQLSAKHQRRPLDTSVFNYSYAPSSAGTEQNEPDALTTTQLSRPTSSHSLDSSSNDALPNKSVYYAKYRQKKLKKLIIAKPISIDCLLSVPTESIETQTVVDHAESREADGASSAQKSKDVGQQSVGIQTTSGSPRQQILFLLHANERFGLEPTSGPTSSDASSNKEKSIDDRAFSNCNSFEYVPGNFQETSSTLSSSLTAEELKRSSVTTSTKDPSTEEDVERSLQVMKRLIRSKKYDEKFKQFYIRRMAKKLMQPANDALESKKNDRVVPETVASQADVVQTSASSGAGTKIVTSGSGENGHVLKSDARRTLDLNVEKHWKEMVTMSEKLYSSLESKSTDSPKECLVNFAKREREQQLDWISSEIEHLAKLKHLLEAKSRRPKSAAISASMPDMGAEYKKSTAVYMITTEKRGGECAGECGSRTTKGAAGEIDFHVHDSLGVRDYKFKEILTTITPRDDDAPARKDDAPRPGDSAQASSLPPRARAPRRSRSLHRCACVSECAPSQAMFTTTCCRPCAPRPACTCLCSQPAIPATTSAPPARRPRDIFPTQPTEASPRSRSPSPKSTSVTDDTSGCPPRRRRSSASPKKAAHRRCARAKAATPPAAGEYAPGDVRNLTAVPVCCAQKKSETDTDSSQYESLTKYQSNGKSATTPSRVLTVEEQSKRGKEVPHSAQQFSVGKLAQCAECHPARYDYMSVDRLNFQTAPSASRPAHISSTSPLSAKKESYKQYKAQKLKEKELQQVYARLPDREKASKRAPKEPDREREKEKVRCYRESPERDKKDCGCSSGKKRSSRTRHANRLSDASDDEPQSISDDGTPKYLMMQQSPLRAPREPKKDAPRAKKCSRVVVVEPPTTENIGTHTGRGRLSKKPSSPLASTTSTPTQHNTVSCGCPSNKNYSKTDTELDKQRQLECASKGKRPGSKTDSEVASRFTNTDFPWQEEEEDEGAAAAAAAAATKADHGRAPCKCPKSLRKMCACVSTDLGPEKPSKTGTVSLQTVPTAPELVEIGVMSRELPRTTQDKQVGDEWPAVKQTAVGDYAMGGEPKESGSQSPAGKDALKLKGELTIAPATVTTFVPVVGHAQEGDSAAEQKKRFRMVKDLSQFDLNSAVVISSVVRPSVSNPDDNIRQLVLEMPLEGVEEEDTIRAGKNNDTTVANINEKGKEKDKDKKKREKGKEKEPEVKDSEFSSLLTCSCLQTSSSRVSTTAFSTTEFICSCCGKCVVSSESSFAMLGDNNMAHGSGFCWPCYCASTKRDWNPADPFYQQPDHMCQCYNGKMEDNALEKIRDTLRQLAEIDNAEAADGAAAAKEKGVKLVCHSCNKKIKRDPTVKKPVAYVLKFEPGEVVDEDEEKPSQQSLQEIRVKVPVKSRKAGVGGSPKKKRKDRGDKGEADAAALSRRDKLQDYLTTNRPDFMRSAEERRRCMIELAYMREQRCKKYQELLALSKEVSQQAEADNPPRPRLFSTKEMKRITAKTYKNLPEVQEKLLHAKRERIKQSNKLLVSVFNKKLRETVLRGQASLSTSINVINL